MSAPEDRSDAVSLAHTEGYFEAQYATEPDPWGFDTAWYERRKYALTMAALPRPRYRRALEPGCANGALTELLAPRCDAIEAFDRVPACVARATVRLQRFGQVAVRRAAFPDHWPEGGGDLVVWSEVAYYLTGAGAHVAVAGLHRWLERGGHLVAVHYTGATDYPMAGHAVGPWLDALPWLQRRVTHLDDSFELGVWERAR